MLNRFVAQSLLGMIPNTTAATIVLAPDSEAPTTVTVSHAWLKPLDVQFTSEGGLHLQGDETRIKIPDTELNPAVNGRELRPRDNIIIDGQTYNVLTARLMSVRTVWDCVVRKVLG